MKLVIFNKEVKHKFILRLIGFILFANGFCVNAVGQETIPIKEWIVLGNSFALHDITSYWWGNWGMAASRRDSDFCHVLNQQIAKWQNQEPIFSVHNIADWEREHNSKYEIQKITHLLSGNEDLIVIRVGECVNNTSNYEEDFEILIDSLRRKSTKAKIIITGNFWPNYQREIGQKSACIAKDCIWCPLVQLCKSENMSNEDSLVYGDDQKWHKISEGGCTASGVANHANDRGHRLMAECIFDSVKAAWRRSVGIIPVSMSDENPVVTEYFDLDGRRIKKPTENGIYIIRTTDALGRRKNRKIFFEGH